MYFVLVGGVFKFCLFFELGWGGCEFILGVGLILGLFNIFMNFF